MWWLGDNLGEQLGEGDIFIKGRVELIYTIPEEANVFLMKVMLEKYSSNHTGSEAWQRRIKGSS